MVYVFLHFELQLDSVTLDFWISHTTSTLHIAFVLSHYHVLVKPTIYIMSMNINDAISVGKKGSRGHQ
jgi:hypothetical protein